MKSLVILFTYSLFGIIWKYSNVRIRQCDYFIVVFDKINNVDNIKTETIQ